MRIVLSAIVFFILMTLLLFKASFVIPPTPAQYALCVIWNACLAASMAVIFKRMSTPRRVPAHRQFRAR